jgi:hypothetical protein
MERLVPSDFRLFARTSDAGDALPPRHCQLDPRTLSPTQLSFVNAPL